ncbi:hypothetical protein DQ04_02371020 [Trypanosoma grayi]|uniref:hypothetical protein n=1 Tax=Trypanosoma grayi TaxID=71804 RepID=UPI0004F4231C|nr:hypothetical protein DQ04_02371020 [Trypanosoma grayi]KEG11679.1 hypothetical protein DQ04_02371020 [Trypanosoma grayi]
MATRVAECNWLLLFDIALSHGESLRQKRLQYGSLLTFLRSAGLLGPKTGVYPILLEALWRLHGCPTQFPKHSEPSTREKSVHDLTVDFDGFLAVMNVVCVRCFQTQKCSDLLEEERPVSEAIILSAEDQVQLKESVPFAARRFFKPLINRCVVLKRMVVSLDSMKNDWTPYTNQFITHIVASAANTIIVPLFRRYAKAGRLYRPAFEEMVENIFPKLTPIQKKGAAAVFDYPGFFGIQHLMEYCRLENTEGATAALELDAFAEALLMLGIVAFSDEAQYEHHRPLTAKVWSVFEDYYSEFVGAPMVPDPIVDNKYASILPVVSLIFPSKVPLDKVSSFIIGGWNLTVDEQRGESFVNTPDYPPRIMQLDGGRKGTSGGGGRRVSGPLPPSTAGLASKLFEEELNRQRCAEYDLPLYGMRRCTVYVNHFRATAFQCGPNRAEVVFPSSMWDASIHKTRIHFAECGEEGRLTLSPFTKATISLRDALGEVIYSTEEVHLVGAPIVESIPISQMQGLKAVFAHHATDGVMPLDQFNEACAKLCVAPLADQCGGCSSFIETYLKQRMDESMISSDHSRAEERSISFTEFASAIATLLLQQLNTDKCIANVPYLLGIAISRATQKLPPLAEQKGIAAPPLMPQPPPKSCPHNARIDVPYANALRRKASSLRLHTGAEKLLRTAGKSGLNSLRLLPEFPEEAKVLSLVSQYNDDENGLSEKVSKASASLREAFLKEEMVVCRQGWKVE